MSGFVGFKFVERFDQRPVITAAERAERRLLTRFGAFVRRRARSSMRRRKRPSLPGEPPSAHAGFLKRIFFVYDKARASVVIGPGIFASRTTRPVGDATGASVQELGGRARRGKRTLRYGARPFMGPAFETEIEGFPAMWAGSVRG